MSDEAKVKRPAKATTINYIESQFSCFQAGIFDAVAVGKSLQKGNYYLYKNEVQKILEEKKDVKDFDANAFVKMLIDAGALRDGVAPALGDNQVKIDSKERALQVANHPDNAQEVEQIVQIMSAIKGLAAKVEPLINTKATVSLALKNKEIKEKKAATAPAESGVPAV